MIAEVIYTGGLRTEARHIKSGNIIHTDAPKDNEGKGEAFSPTDIASTSLASCALTIMGIAAKKYGIDMEGTRAEVYKTMASNPRRIAEISVKIYMPEKSFSAKERKILEKAAHNCPVALSLHPDTMESVELFW